MHDVRERERGRERESLGGESRDSAHEREETERDRARTHIFSSAQGNARMLTSMVSDLIKYMHHAILRLACEL